MCSPRCHRREVRGALLVGAEMLQRAGDEWIAQHVGDAGRAELLLQNPLLVRVSPLAREAIEPVSGLVERAHIPA